MPIKRSYADYGDACATAHAMELLGDRWTYPILRELMLAPKRFNELAGGVRGITPAVLTGRLRELETAGLVAKAEPQDGSRAAAYRITEWGHELRPVFESLGRWAQASPVLANDGCGLTPDSTVQSMLTMAPAKALTPTELELRLHDGRIASAPQYVYRLHWARELAITRESAPGATATVTGDSSTWARVLYDGEPLTSMEISGKAADVRRVVKAFASGPTPTRSARRAG